MSTFDDEKRMQPYMDAWYRSMGATLVDRSRSCVGFDVIVNIANQTWKVEEKYLFTEEYENGLIEIFQDMEKPDNGWFYHTACDILVWVYCGKDNGRGENESNPPLCLYSNDFKKMKPYIIEKLKDEDWVKFNICNKHYGLTLNLPVKWAELEEKSIAKKYIYKDVVIP